MAGSPDVSWERFLARKEKVSHVSTWGIHSKACGRTVGREGSRQVSPGGQSLLLVTLSFFDNWSRCHLRPPETIELRCLSFSARDVHFLVGWVGLESVQLLQDQACWSLTPCCCKRREIRSTDQTHAFNVFQIVLTWWPHCQGQPHITYKSENNPRHNLLFHCSVQKMRTQVGQCSRRVVSAVLVVGCWVFIVMTGRPSAWLYHAHEANGKWGFFNYKSQTIGTSRPWQWIETTHIFVTFRDQCVIFMIGMAIAVCYRDSGLHFSVTGLRMTCYWKRSNTCDRCWQTAMRRNASR